MENSERQRFSKKKELARKQLRKAAGRHDGSIGSKLAWRRVLDSFRRRAKRINSEINDYNRLVCIERPVGLLDIEYEIAEMQKEINGAEQGSRSNEPES